MSIKTDVSRFTQTELLLACAAKADHVDFGICPEAFQLLMAAGGVDRRTVRIDPVTRVVLVEVSLEKGNCRFFASTPAEATPEECELVKRADAYHRDFEAFRAANEPATDVEGYFGLRHISILRKRPAAPAAGKERAQ